MLLVTGGTGFIGRHVVKLLLNDGYSVRLLARNPEQARIWFPKAAVMKGDILHLASLEKAMDRVTGVIHLAGRVSYTCPKEELFTVNYEGTRNVLKAAVHAERFLFASSVALYGPVQNAPESAAPHPQTPYAESKYAAEQAVLSSPLKTVALRLAPVYGIGAPSFERAMAMLVRGFPIPKTKASTHIVHVSDAARAFLLAMKKGSGPCNIAGESIPFVELASLLSYHLGVRPKFWPPWLVFFLARLGGKLDYVKTLAEDRTYDTGKAGKELGFEPEAYMQKELKLMVEAYMSRQEHKHGIKIPLF